MKRNKSVKVKYYTLHGIYDMKKNKLVYITLDIKEVKFKYDLMAANNTNLERVTTKLLLGLD